MHLKFFLYGILALGIILEILSYMLFEGLFADLNYYCGSACEIWPGIPISENCIEICVLRNGFYFPSFILGTILIAGSIISLIYYHRSQFR